MVYRLYKEFGRKRFVASHPLAASRAWFRWPFGILSWMLTQAFVFAGWMFFFYPVKDALHYMYLMFHA
jgi:hypothetical protein